MAKRIAAATIAGLNKTHTKKPSSNRRWKTAAARTGAAAATTTVAE